MLEKWFRDESFSQASPFCQVRGGAARGIALTMKLCVRCQEDVGWLLLTALRESAVATGRLLVSQSSRRMIGVSLHLRDWAVAVRSPAFVQLSKILSPNTRISHQANLSTAPEERTEKCLKIVALLATSDIVLIPQDTITPLIPSAP